MKKILHFFLKKKRRKKLFGILEILNRERKKKLGSIWGRDLKQSMEKINSFFTDFFFTAKTWKVFFLLYNQKGIKKIK